MWLLSLLAPGFARNINNSSATLLIVSVYFYSLLFIVIERIFFLSLFSHLFHSKQSPTPPQYVYWQKNDRMINYDDSRRDISIDTIPGLRTQSRLIIREPQTTDSGNYTCSASNTEPASIYVFVSKGKHTILLIHSPACKVCSGNLNNYRSLLFQWIIFIANLLILSFNGFVHAFLRHSQTYSISILHSVRGRGSRRKENSFQVLAPS